VQERADDAVEVARGASLLQLRRVVLQPERDRLADDVLGLDVGLAGAQLEVEVEQARAPPRRSAIGELEAVHRVDGELRRS
jgi:hypothetical protein